MVAGAVGSARREGVIDTERDVWVVKTVLEWLAAIPGLVIDRPGGQEAVTFGDVRLDDCIKVR